MPDQQPHEAALFDAVLQLPPEQRSAHLDRECGADTALRQRIEALLKACERTRGFLDQPAAPVAAQGGNPAFNVVERPGDIIGPYKLLQQIGEGGCGVVYMAEQEKPVQRRVALKVIKLGMDTRSVIARFEAERQALALMDHPNIAKVLEAGATDAGRPYFVMELVRGVKITEFCDHNNLSTASRLDLFIQVCRAVQHAHQKGIIHRDIKPSNILVTLHDGVPVPKVIDFGIAKATQGRLTDKTVFTAFEQFLGTPAYTSPEQAEMTSLDIDTRSDIYSLGVLLYELLTGKTPFETKDLLAAGLDAMRRIIREKEPERPSTKLSTMLGGELTITANRRQTEPPKLLSSVRGDLDWIVMKCLEKDRARRYETASGLVSDLQRHLNQEPVLACPPSRLYRFKKLLGRNKLAFAASVAVAVALVSGLTISTWSLLQERQARRRAVAAEHEQSRLLQEANLAREQAQAGEQNARIEAARSREFADFLKQMLKAVRPAVALGRDKRMLQEILDQTAAHLGRDLTNQPEVQIDLLLTLGETYGGLGLQTQAEKSAREALALAQKTYGPGVKGLAVRAEGLVVLAGALHSTDKLEEAEAGEREALAIRKKLFGEEHPLIAEVLGSLAWLLFTTDRLPEAESLARQALAMRKKLLGYESEGVADSLHQLAGILDAEGLPAQAEVPAREALALRRQLLGEVHPQVAESLNGLGLVLRAEKKFAEAEEALRQALEMRTNLLSNTHPDVALTLRNLALVLQDEGKLDEAEPMYRASLEIRKKLFNKEHRFITHSLNSLAGVLREKGQLNEAEALCREALAVWQNKLVEEHSGIASVLLNLASICRIQGRLEEAETLTWEALAMHKRLLGGEHPDVAQCLDNLALVLSMRGCLPDAESARWDALDIYRRLPGAAHPGMIKALNSLARLLLIEGKADQAEPLALECLTMLEKDSPDGWRAPAARSLVGGTLLGQKKYAQAEPWLLSGYEKLKPYEKQVPSTSRVQFREALERLVQLYQATGRPDQAAEWKQKLAEFEKAGVERRRSAPQP